MLEKLKYINHMNEKLEFGENGVYVNGSDLHDYSWTHTAKNDRISSFKKGIVKKTIPVVVMCKNEDEGIKIRNKLMEKAEKDVLALIPGTLYIGDYYLKCYITGSKKKDYYHNCYIQMTLSLVTDLPVWIKETTTTFGYGKGAAGKNLDFNNDFSYDYSSNLLNKKLNNENFIESNFRIVIYGPCEEPEIIIGGHSYQVNTILEDNEYITIDSIEKTIVLTRRNGEKVNCFNLRNKDSYIFKKIPPGISGVSIGHFKFDITLLEERSEPKWT